MVEMVKANGIALAVYDHGPKDGAPLILIRGQGSQSAHWPDVLIRKFCEAGFRTITFDNRDTGQSQRCPKDGSPSSADEILRLIEAGGAIDPPYRISDMADDVVGLMDALGLEKAHMMGISMGGAILQTIVTENPERLLTATIVMTACRPLTAPDGDNPRAANALAKSLLAYPQTLQEYQDAQVLEHQLWGSPGYPMPESDIRQMAELAYGRCIDPEGRNRQVLALAVSQDRRPALREVDLPCLVLHGRDDTLVPVALGEEIAANIPHSEFHAIDGMGHIITPALAPVIVDLVAGFVRRRAS
ncbi:alpha/beta hydrolase [Seohaeicola saemankumensis]|nr:alpha/beta hydrolase [Seohaeicola saemankumensis]MCA0871584.1 alpha/beta hydrolase [Seohaeicola saemankumensis]